MALFALQVGILIASPSQISIMKRATNSGLSSSDATLMVFGVRRVE
jgi:hypothetical protein